MRCLCCGKEILPEASAEEKRDMWHERCVRKFFGTKSLPVIDVTRKELDELVNETVSRGLTVTGVQKKLSLHLSVDVKNKLTVVNYPTGFILKPQTEEYEALPEFEILGMHLAEIAGIKTVPHALIRLHDDYAYITKRIDREIRGEKTLRFAMEDFCQLSYRLTQDKYKGSYEQCGRIVDKYSDTPGFDMTELYLRIVFSFLMGNSDMHLKNFSLIEEKPGNRQFHLSAAYDLLPVNVIMPEDTEEMALALNGKKRNLRKKDFYRLADSYGMPLKAAEKMIERLVSLKDAFLAECDRALLKEEQKKAVKKLITQRTEILY